MCLSSEQFRKLVCEYLAALLCVKCPCWPKIIGREKTTRTTDVELDSPSSALLTNGDSSHQQMASPASPAAAAAAVGQIVSGAESLLVNIRDLLKTSVHTKAQLRREEEKKQQIMEDWMIAARVIDRICFIFITLFFTGITLALIILRLRPHDPNLPDFGL